MSTQDNERRPLPKEKAAPDSNGSPATPDSTGEPWLLPILGRVGAELHFGNLAQCGHEDRIKRDGGTVDLFHPDAAVTVRCDKCADEHREAFGPLKALSCLKCGSQPDAVFNFMPWRQLVVRMALCGGCWESLARERGEL